ncbi:hypothetical protein VTK73DRAFT_196 [Phialemonium thermophilum]|uniref:Kelch repeat protein n=1 Tax=Phialemonium thermophilum TaxID=223376 RepID=A0ABR3XGC5_9PEZI
MPITSAKWSRVVFDPRLRRSSQALSVVAKKAYMFGGELVARQPVDNDLYVIQLDQNSGPSIQTITAEGEAPTPRVGSPSTRTEGTLWLFSGRGGLEMKPIEERGALWGYEVDVARWKMVQPTDSSAPYPAGRSYHCITSNGKNTVYVHSGCPEKGRLSDLWAFDLQQKAWSELPPAPAPARGGASIAYLSGKLYRLNGFDGKTEQGGNLDVFDISAGSWSVRRYRPDGIEGPEPRSVSTLLPVTVHGNDYLITMFGERDPSSLGHAGAGKMLGDAWVWDVQDETWQRLNTAGDTPEPRGWFDADVVSDDDAQCTVFIHGGLSEQNERLGDIWSLNLT